LGTAARAPAASSRVEARRAATRALILDAAWELAREVGLTGFTLRQLAERVGMRAPSLYEYFAGKDAIYDAMFAQGNEAFLAVARAVPPTEQVGLRGALAVTARAFLGFATEDHVRFQLLFQHSIAGWQPSPAAYAPAMEVTELLRTRLTEVGATDPRSADLWTAMLSGLAHQQVANDPDGRRWHDLVDEVVDLFLVHLERSTTDGPA
jgi:AcrR family transcriptional regulator